MDIHYQGIAEQAVAYAAQNNIRLDYSAESFERVDDILEGYYEHLSEYQDENGAKTLWNIAVLFGIYLGETLLRFRLEAQGYHWRIDEGLPILEKDAGNQMSPITKAHKRILNGPEDSVKSFCEIALLIAKGKFPTKKVHRAVDVELSSGRKEANVPYREIDSFIRYYGNRQSTQPLFPSIPRNVACQTKPKSCLNDIIGILLHFFRAGIRLL